MKKFLTLLTLSTVLFIAGCNGDIINISNGSVTVMVQPSDLLSTAGSITVTERPVISAIIELSGPSGFQSVSWTTNGVNTFTFPVLVGGTHTLSISETDTSGFTNSYSTNLVLTAGNNYTISLKLGGIALVIVEPGTNDYTNIITNTNLPSDTNKYLDLTIIWTNISTIEKTWNGSWKLFEHTHINNDNTTNYNAYPVITGGSPWMHQTNASWDPTVGGILTMNLAQKTATFHVVLTNVNVSNAQFMMSSLAGWNYGVEDGMSNHYIEQDLSGVVTQYVNYFKVPDTNKYLDLTIIWTNISTIERTWNGSWKLFEHTHINNDNTTNYNAYPVITGGSPWMHQTNAGWDPTIGKLLTMNLAQKTATFHVVLTNVNVSNAMFKMSSLAGWNYGVEDGITNHYIEQDLSGVVTQYVNYFKVPDTNKYLTITFIWTNVPNTFFYNGGTWHPFTGLYATTNFVTNYSYPTITGGAEWMHTSNVIWYPQSGRLLTLDSINRKAYITLYVTNNPLSNIGVMMTGTMGWVNGHERESHNDINIPLEGVYTQTMNFNQ